MFTGRFNSKLVNEEEYTIISIANTLPKFNLPYKVSLQYQVIAPDWKAWNARTNQRLFDLYYRMQLETIGFDNIFPYLQSLRKCGKPLLLLCHEDLRNKRNLCHRRLFAKWWEGYTGIEVPELDDIEAQSSYRFQSTKQPLFDLLQEDIVSQVIS